MQVLSGPFEGEDSSSFKKFPFELDSFQKHAIQSIDASRNVLVTAFTGSGKTLVAEYATMKSLERGKRIIYTSPIKSLSNQKFYEFKQKFPDASVGLFTGDIKFNPFGNIIIMTTEILRNMLYRRKDNEVLRENDLNIDLENEVDTVVFDEIHYINDKDRGKVWEECIILLPKTIKLVGLSATIDRAEEFALWVHQVRQRPIDLIPTFKRNVPLRHFYYLHGASKEGETLLDKISHRLVPLLNPDERTFHVQNYENLIRVKRDYNKLVGKENYGQTGMLNPLVRFLTERDLCPALFFVFSRKKCEEYAMAVTKPLLTSQEQSQVEKLIEQQMLKIQNRERYSNLSQFHMLKRMLMKGVSVHHSGLIPIFKELIELLFAQKLVKVLFATETFAVGVNMPTKTVLYTELSKRDNNGYRMLMTNEFTQMSGRAGRRGIDTVGHVILLPNLFKEMPSLLDIQQMMLGRSQRIESKFTIDYLFILKQASQQQDLAEDEGKPSSVANASLLGRELQQRIVALEHQEQELLSQRPQQVDESLFTEYEDLMNQQDFLKLSRKAEKERRGRILAIQSLPEFHAYQEGIEWKAKQQKLQDELFFDQTFIEYYTEKISLILKDHHYLEPDDSLTVKGIVASNISECNPILLTEMLIRGMFDTLSGPEIAAFLSIFLSDSNDSSNLAALNIPRNVKDRIKSVQGICDAFLDFESIHELYLNSNWVLNFSFTESSYCWARNEPFVSEDRVFEGDFVKAMLKLVSLSQTLGTVAEILGQVELISKLKALESVIMRDIVSVESLYIF
jgi:superfamily II RNA helicase